MTAKEYLQQAYRLDEMINSGLKRLDHLKDLASNVSDSNFSDMPLNGARNTDPPFVRCIPKIIDLEHKIDDEIDRLVDLKNEITARLEAVPNADYKLLLTSRYLNFETWESIAEIMQFSVQWVHELHKRALKNFGEIYGLT